MGNHRSTDADWKEALEEELAMVAAKARQPRPEGIDQTTWDGILAGYKAQMPVLQKMIAAL